MEMECNINNIQISILLYGIEKVCFTDRDYNLKKLAVCTDILRKQ